MRLYVVRHGETDHNNERRIQGPLLDGPLNARGKEQAERLAAWFRGRAVKAVFTSPMKRAAETAQAIAAALDLDEVTALPGLVEFSWGELLGQKDEGAIRAELMTAIQAWQAGNLDHAAKGGESPRAAWIRASRDLLAVFEEIDDGEIVLVAHGRLNKVLLAGLVHGDLSRMEEFPQPNASVTILEYDGRDWRVVTAGTVDHLHGIGALEEHAS